MPRKIIHCDCDCFFAAIEMRDNPSLRNIPLAIGGQPEQRGVIATCNWGLGEIEQPTYLMPVNQCWHGCGALVRQTQPHLQR